MNFKALVTNTLLHEDENAQEQVATSAIGFLTSKYRDVQKEYAQKYANYEQFRSAFPDEQNYKALIYNAANAAVRTVQDSDRYSNIRDIFPILDLVGLVVQSYGRESGPNKPQLAETGYNDFINRLKAAKGAPLEYEPMSPWAKKVKEDFFSGKQKLDLGKTRLEAPEFQNQSLYFVIQKLFEMRLKGRSNILKLDNDSPIKSQKFVDLFLFDSRSYINGVKPVPEQRIKDLYNDISPSLILEVAKNAYDFFEQQADVNLGGMESLKSKENEAFRLFLANKLDWGLYKTNTQEPSLQTNSLTIFSNLTNKLLSELNSNLGDAATNQMKPKRQNPTEKPDPFVDENGKSNYSLGKIVANRSQVPAANNLYNSLVKLADYVRKQAENDWKGLFNALAQMAQALSFGVPNLGGKRT